LAKTGPEKYLTAQDLENVICELREENERLKGFEDESKSLRADKEILAKLFGKCEEIKRDYENVFIEAELVRKDP
jgi:cell shape-determining protein MreC